MMYTPRSCDTFSVLPPNTAENCIVFGKNSDRPSDEVQEVVYVPATDFDDSCKLKCTYIEIDQVSHTYATILSKPSWMWGAEMGANEHNVCIGNEAVWTKLNDDSDSDEKLLGMDLLRLGLERARTAVEAIDVIVSLIDKYGMGGNCSDTIPDFTYHNSFLIADPTEVWVLECAGSVWAAERVTYGVRNISNELTIGTKIDLMSDNLENFAKEKGFWSDEKGPLNFKLAFGLDEDEQESHRYSCGKRLLTEYSKNRQFTEADMFKVLRDKPSGICMYSGSFLSTGSQVSVLRKSDSDKHSCHWFTATPDPSRSVFKPFVFVENVDFPREVISPVYEMKKKADRRHFLYIAQQKFYRKQSSTADIFRTYREKIEAKYMELLNACSPEIPNSALDIRKLFKLALEEEMKMYQ